MPPDRGRASKACIACRKQKTRCYESVNGRACLRCERVGQKCSLDVQESINSNIRTDLWQDGAGNIAPQSRDARFERLERILGALIQRVDDLEGGRSHSSRVYQDEVNERDSGSQHQDEPDTAVEGSAPLFVLRDVTAESGFRATDRTATNTPSRGFTDDIILKRLISPQEAFSLLSMFQEHYGRWVSFDPLIPTAILLEDVRKSPLLLTACSLIAVRHTSQDLASRLAPTLFKEAKALISAAMLSTPQPIEFFQASLILSMWSTTIGQVPLSIDSWLLSGFALQHSITSGLFGFATDSKSGLNKHELDRLCVWNHLCLVHLHYCVGTRRKAVIDRRDIEKCRVILESDHATNFESRMVAEIFLYWIVYETCSASVDLPKTQTAFQKWKLEWQYLFDQPRSQFVQMGFCFAQLLTYDLSLKTRSAAARESLLNEMVRLSTTIINVAMETADERTRHLTDHIYHMISFAAVTLSRLLHNYEEQLALSHDLHRLDTLILSLVSWLHAIGLPCHVAYTMGNVVAAFHKKLRPDSGPSPSTSYAEVDPAIHDDFAQLFPELFGASTFNLANGSMLPDFQPVP
ncbi:Nn.00g058260.m01.CDS01 [Neocucurbitaria sp. VM-36]